MVQANVLYLFHRYASSSMSRKLLSTYQSGTSTMGGFIYQVYIIILWEWYGSGIGKILVGVVWGM